MSDIVQTLPGIKRGDTLTLTWSLPLAFGNLIDTVLAQVNQSNGDEVQYLTITPMSDTLTHKVWQLSATAEQTRIWPLRYLQLLQ